MKHDSRCWEQDECENLNNLGRAQQSSPWGLQLGQLNENRAEAEGVV